MSSRVAQVLYTATSLQPNARSVDIEGKPLEFLGGEGLLLEQRQESFEALALVVLFR